ncbi:MULTISPECIES: LacI family DNA-binding transcriptional regulator [Bacillales]|uniref:LacI family transcriptional regulator n=1 Tax=Brevibacillus aydinogluensis TaxID=927786 RepID=A0AA48M9A5_9BACL|nr:MULTISPECIES: LacI family DNA-binding transcriptional regulator [Bacillales]REK68234.1 MAG: LacI family transcriptional regulator [Brevibacillus sp.]MBR8661247.1 LacI family DNA-binding transcriptional regulator [Brevibacillus sp. NL20B1]MDT3415160.1 LacI family sucrose operon transcriptional repressor [Brevibacillus aydinogluensis]NNV01687.1 LacI family transcriptional regulator [Brevibacillus sp. MCWH]UFJ60938.1 LacI family DNA-binding transcriptional regulator [Anoxybacillus sediminis]
MNKTIADVAKLSGVAKSTVSRYLNGGSVSEATKRKIERAIKETGYTPNPFAQSLKAKKTAFIGTIVPRLDSYAASHTIIGIDEQLKELHFQLLISNTNQQIEREIEMIYSLAGQKVAGIILLATQITPAHLAAFEKVNIPILLVGQEHPDVHSLIHNDVEAGYAIGKYVVEKGHRKIAYLGVSEQDVAVGVKRKEGFKRAIAEAEGCEVHYFETGFNMFVAQQAAAELLEQFRPTCIVCATDNIALGALRAAQLKGLRIPQDVSITGFGGYDVTEIIHPGLTTVKLFFKEAGKMAAQHIVKLINEEEVPKRTLSKFEIIERESVDSIIPRHV